MSNTTSDKVYSVMYHHRHGEDAWVYKTYLGAVNGIADCILENLEDEVQGEDVRMRIQQLCSLGEQAAAWALYEENCNEWFEITASKLRE